MSVPSVNEYHPYLLTGYDETKCRGRRTDDDTAQDRRWKPFVHRAYQCSNAPVSGTHLCETCNRHLALYEATGNVERSNWHGTVDDGDTFETLPADSHIMGSAWFHAKAKWVGVAKAKTAKQDGRLKTAPKVPQKELDRFARGECELDLETLAAKNQVNRENLRAILRKITTDPVSEYLTKTELITRIRRQMAGPVSSSNAAASPPPTETPQDIINRLTAQVADLTALLADREAQLATKDAMLAGIRSAMGM